MELFIAPNGAIRVLYTEEIDLQKFGRLSIDRVSHVEPSGNGEWFAKILDGPALGPFSRRSEAIAAEIDWVTRNRLPSTATKASSSTLTELDPVIRN